MHHGTPLTRASKYMELGGSDAEGKIRTICRGLADAKQISTEHAELVLSNWDRVCLDDMDVFSHDLAGKTDDRRLLERVFESTKKCQPRLAALCARRLFELASADMEERRARSDAGAAGWQLEMSRAYARDDDFAAAEGAVSAALELAPALSKELLARAHFHRVRVILGGAPLGAANAGRAAAAAEEYRARVGDLTSKILAPACRLHERVLSAADAVRGALGK